MLHLRHLLIEESLSRIAKVEPLISAMWTPWLIEIINDFKWKLLLVVFQFFKELNNVCLNCCRILGFSKRKTSFMLWVIKQWSHLLREYMEFLTLERGFCFGCSSIFHERPENWYYFISCWLPNFQRIGNNPDIWRYFNFKIPDYSLLSFPLIFYL